MRLTRLREKWWAKALAAILLFVFCIGFIAGAGGMYICDMYDVYHSTIDNKKDLMRGIALDKYAVAAIANYKYGAKAELSPNYHYAIYEGSDQVVAGDLKDVPEDAVIHEFQISDNSTYLIAKSIFDGAYVHEGADNSMVEEQIEQFYYRKVDFAAADAAAAGSEPPTSETVAVVADAREQEKDTDASEALPEQTEVYVSGSESSATTIFRVDPSLYRIDEKTGMLWVKRYGAPGEMGIPGSAVKEIDINALDKVISPRVVYRFYFDEGFGEQGAYGWFDARAAVEGTVYTVAGTADLPLKVTTGKWETADFFEQADMLIEGLYRIRYATIALLIMSGILALLMFVFLMWSAGHRPVTSSDIITQRSAGIPENAASGQAAYAGIGTGALRLRMIDRLPMDLAFLITMALCSICAIPAIELWEIRTRPVQSICILLAFMAIAYAFALEYCMSLAVNFKVGGWWGRSILGRIWKLIVRLMRWSGNHLKRICRSLRESAAGVQMGPRVWGLFALFVFFEFCGLLVLSHQIPVLLFCCLAEKIIFFFILEKILREFGQIKKTGEEIAGGNLEYKLNTENMLIDFANVGNSLNTIGDGISAAVDERMKSERMKTELITNVSHDIKTPLTSIINYTDLLTKLDLKDPKAQEYLEVLGRQSARLKKLIEDLIEASKASSGALKLDMETVNVSMLLMQAAGEYEEKFAQRNLDLRITGEDAALTARADSRYLWRIFDNLMSNMLKYAQPGTRAYIDLASEAGEVCIVFRNISESPLHISGDELMERFVRGDSSRSSEGSGLGLSIADSLITLMGGRMELSVDGDLFKVIVRIPAVAGSAL